MRNEGKKNERRSTPPSFGILLLPRQIGSEHVLHHKLPSKQTKRKKDGFQFKYEVINNWSSSPSRSRRRRRSARKTFSLFLSLSLSVGKKYTLQEGTAPDSFCAVYITAFRNRRCSLCCVIIVSITSFHQKGEREREIRDLSRARTAREQLKRAWERYKTKKPPSSRAVLIRI